MKRYRPAIVALALLTAPLSAQTTTNPVGNWKAVFVGPIGPRPKMVDVITFSIQSTPTGLAGTAQAASWPGELEVSDLKFEGSRLTFIGTGKEGWSTGVGGNPMQYHCCPKLKFAGTIQGDQMKLMLTWTSTEFDDPNKEALPMEATRVSGGAAPVQEVRRYLEPRTPADTTLPPFSKAVQVGNTLYLSGDIGVNEKREVPATAEAEATAVLTSIQNTLKSAGMTMDDLVYLQVFCSNVAHYDAFNGVYRTFFKREFPARAFIGSGPLLFGARFEVQGIAVKR